MKAIISISKTYCQLQEFIGLQMHNNLLASSKSSKIILKLQFSNSSYFCLVRFLLKVFQLIFLLNPSDSVNQLAQSLHYFYDTSLNNLQGLKFINVEFIGQRLLSLNLQQFKV